MKIKVNTDEIKNAVSTVIPALAVRSEAVYTKVYEFIYISASEGRATLKCCNLSMQIETNLPAFCEEEGDLLVPGKLFSDIVSKLPSEETIIERIDDTVKIVSGKMNMKLQTIPASEFEGINLTAGDVEISIPEITFKKMVLQTSPFALQDNSRPVLRGVFLEVFGDELNMVALDPLKLAMRCEKINNVTGHDTSIIIPSKLLENGARILEDSNENIKVVFSRQSLTVITQNTTLIFLKLDGTYIPYRDLFPKSFDTRVTLNRKEFISLTERAYLVAKDDNKNVVKLVFSEDNLNVLVDNEVGSVNDNMSVFMSGKDITICFNIKCFIDVVKYIDADDIALEMTQPNRPCVIKPIEGNSFCYLVLPMMIQ